jgi:hypothetical protein
MKFDVWLFFENLSRKFKFQYNGTIITGTLHYHQCIFFIISRSVSLRTKNVSDKLCRGNQNTHFMFRNFFLNCAVYEIILKNLVDPHRPQMIIRRMRFACWVSKVTHTHTHTQTHTQYVIFLYVHCLFCLIRNLLSISLCYSNRTIYVFLEKVKLSRKLTVKQTTYRLKANRTNAIAGAGMWTIGMKKIWES